MAVDAHAKKRISPISGVVASCPYPTVVWDTTTWRLVLVTDEAAELVGSTADSMIGRPASDFLEMTDGVTEAARALRDGGVEDVHAKRTLKRQNSPRIDVQIWTKTFTISERRYALSAILTEADVALLASDSTRPWRELFHTAVGFVDRSGRIVSVSREISTLLGGKPEEWVGEPLTEIVMPEEAELVRHALSTPARTRMVTHVCLRRSDGEPAVAWLATSREKSEEEPAAAFAVGTYLDQPSPADRDRIDELELRLRRIGAEVQAAGMLDVILHHRPANHRHPALADLSTRQWEILSRLRRGDRVQTIADDLFLSPSTVRNHLTQIFRKFGVHTQADLLAALSSPALA